MREKYTPQEHPITPLRAADCLLVQEMLGSRERGWRRGHFVQDEEGLGGAGLLAVEEQMIYIAETCGKK